MTCDDFTKYIYARSTILLMSLLLGLNMFELANMIQNRCHCAYTGCQHLISYGNTKPVHNNGCQKVKDAFAICHRLCAGKRFWLQPMLLPALSKSHIVFCFIAYYQYPFVRPTAGADCNLGPTWEQNSRAQRKKFFVPGSAWNVPR